jgi:hypothetical protein
LTELLVTGKKWGVLAVMVCSRSYPVHLFDVPRHNPAERRILNAVGDWWRRHDAGEMGKPSAAEGLAEMLDDGSHVDLSRDNHLPALLDEREILKQQAGAADKRLKEIDYEIKNRVGAARTAWLPGWSISFPTQHRKETLIPASDYRVLRIKRMEEADAAD